MRLPKLHAGSIARAIAAVGVLLTTGSAILLGYELALLVLSTSVLALVIVLFWSSVRNLAGDTPLSLDEALSMGAPTAAEEQKRAILRALKDLDFERSVGKISEQDYLEYSARYRAEARKLMSAFDETSAPAKDLAEKLAAERLAKAGLEVAAAKGKATPTTAEPDAAADPAEKPDGNEEGSSDEAPAPRAAASKANGNDDAEKPAAKGRTCTGCATHNDVDARFCKACGTPLAAAPRAETSSEEQVEEKIS